MQIVANKKQLWAVVVFLMIPAIMTTGGVLFNVIDPEKLAGHTNYVRNYRLLELARSAVMLAVFGLTVVAWFVTCVLMLRSKNRSHRWLLLALFGPVGFVFLASLRDHSSEPSSLYERFNRRLNGFRRVLYEIFFYIVGLTLAWQMMLIQREAIIFFQSAMTGVSRQQIVDQQNASSGMWAFSEGLEVMYFLVLLYLLRPVCVDVVGFVFKGHRSPVGV